MKQEVTTYLTKEDVERMKAAQAEKLRIKQKVMDLLNSIDEMV